jgi:hypothetical protein
MDDMGTPSDNHPAKPGLDKRTESQFNNVYDLNASRVLKGLTGKATPIKHVETNPDWEEHVRSALENSHD